MINPTIKQIVQGSTKTLQTVNGVNCSLIEGRRFLRTTAPKLDDDNKHSKSNCDTGRCSRLNMDVKGILDRPESNYLQPSKTQQASRRFVESKPVFKSEIVYEHELYCREREDCKKIERNQNGEGKKDK